ncbi:MAG: hypothetical protein P1V97_27690 [Planctomycetota bacterium]|nr:hypothetical protein [Planctomycetota bacterium]
MLPISLICLLTLIAVSLFVFLLRFSNSSGRHQFWKPDEHIQLAKQITISDIKVETGPGQDWSLTGNAKNNADCALVAVVIVFRPGGFGNLECLTSIEELGFEEICPFKIDVLVPKTQVKKPYQVYAAEARRKIR